MNAAELVVQGDPARARATAAEALQARGFRLTWNGEWDAVAERGNKVANFVVGALAQYMKITVLLRSNPDGTSTVRIEKSNSGAMGGVLGASRTRKNFETLVQQLADTFAHAGVLLGQRAV